MENGDYPTKDPHTNDKLSNDVRDIFSLLMNDITTMTKPNVIKYLQAYANQYKLDTAPTYYALTSLTDMRDQLTQAAVELHANCTPKYVSTTTTHNQVLGMDPIIVYKELFQIELQHNSSYNVSNILAIKYDHAKERLLSTLNAMDIEPTTLNNDDFDDLFNEDDNDDDPIIDDSPDFVLTHSTTDADINKASYADMLYQMRLREKKFHNLDRSQLEELSIEHFLREVKACRDRIKKKYKIIENAYNKFNPSLYDTLDNESIVHEYNVFAKNNHVSSIHTTHDDMRVFLKSKHPAWDSILKRMITLDEIAQPPLKAITYYRYDKREVEMQAYHIYLLPNDQIEKLPPDTLKSNIVTCYIFLQKKYDNNELNIMTVPLLQGKLKELKSILTNKTNITKTNAYKKEYASFSDEQINNFSKPQLIDLIQRFHVYSQQTYVDSKYVAMNLIQLKAEVTNCRDTFKTTLNTDTSTSMEYDPIVLTVDTSNKRLEQLAHKGAIVTLKQHLINMNIGFDSTFFSNHSKHDIQTELKKLRNALIKEHQLASQSKTSPEQDISHSFQTSTPNPTSQALVTSLPVTENQSNNMIQSTHNSTQWSKRVGNRNGININTLTPSKSKISMRSDSAPNLDKQNQYQVVEHNDNNFYLRANLPIKDYVTHIPTIIKSFFLTLQQADPSILLLPFDFNNKSSQDTIEKESALPNEEAKIKKWVSGIRIKNNRITFAIRIQNNMSIVELKSVLSAWEAKTGSQISMDNIRSSRKFSAGWLQFAHPRFINRDDLKQWMVAQSENKNVGNWFKLFSRGIFESDAEKAKKTLTTAIVIDGSLDNVEEFMTFLYGIEWNSIYSGINFIPFQKDDHFTEKEHQIAIKQHNLYLRSLKMEVLTVKNPNKVFTTDEGHSGTLLQWLFHQTINNKKLFQHVTQIGVTKVLLSFYSDAQQQAVHFIKKLIPHFTQVFGDNNTIEIFGINHNNDVRRSASQSQLSHSQKLKQRILGNPQGCDDDDAPPPTINNRGYYGKPPLEPTITNTKSFVNAVNANEDTSSNNTQLPEATNNRISDLENLVNNIKSAQENTQKELTVTKTSIETLTRNVNERFDEVEKQSSKTINDFIDEQKRINNEKVQADYKREESFKQWIMDTLSKKESPSGVEQSSARGAEK